MAKFSRDQKKVVKMIEVYKKDPNIFNDFTGKPEMIQMLSQIKSRTVANSIGIPGDDQDGDLIQVEDLLNINWPNSRGFLWQWWTDLINYEERKVASLGLKVIPISKKEDKKDDKEKIENKDDVSNNVIAKEETTKIPAYKITAWTEKINNYFAIGGIYGKSILAVKDKDLVYGNYIRNETKDGRETAVIQKMNYFDLENVSYNTPSGDSKTPTYKIKSNKEDEIIVDLDKCVIFKPRANGIGDLAWQAGRSPIPIFFRWLLMGEGANAVSKIIQEVKDNEESNNESKRLRNIFTRFLKISVDKQGIAKNTIKAQTLNENVSKQLMDIIQLIKFIDEDFSKFRGEPSAGHKRQSLSGEFASGSSQWIYEYEKFSQRVELKIAEINELVSDLGIKVELDKSKQPTQLIAQMDNGGMKGKGDGNLNAEKEQPKTADIKEGVK